MPARPIIVQNQDTLISNAEAGNQWYLNNSEIADANTQNYIVSVNGEYYAVITNDLGCSSPPSNIISITHLSKENLEISDLKIYPNPASELVTITGLPGYEGVELAIYNISGIYIMQNITTSKEIQINIKYLEAGAYTLIIKNLSNQENFRFSIQKI